MWQHVCDWNTDGVLQYFFVIFVGLYSSSHMFFYLLITHLTSLWFRTYIFSSFLCCLQKKSPCTCSLYTAVGCKILQSDKYGSWIYIVPLTMMLIYTGNWSFKVINLCFFFCISWLGDRFSSYGRANICVFQNVSVTTCIKRQSTGHGVNVADHLYLSLCSHTLVRNLGEWLRCQSCSALTLPSLGSPPCLSRLLDHVR